MKEFFPIIHSSQLFSGVSKDELPAVLSCLEAKKVSFPKDAFLLRTGDTAESIGLVLSGSVLIVVPLRKGMTSALPLLSSDPYGRAFY